MNDQEWQEFRRDYLSRYNVYIPDTSEAREQFDENTQTIEVPVRQDRSDVLDNLDQRHPINIELSPVSPESIPVDPKKRMLEAMKKRRNVP